MEVEWKWNTLEPGGDLNPHNPIGSADSESHAYVDKKLITLTIQFQNVKLRR